MSFVGSNHKQVLDRATEEAQIVVSSLTDRPARSILSEAESLV